MAKKMVVRKAAVKSPAGGTMMAQKDTMMGQMPMMKKGMGKKMMKGKK